MRKRPLSEEEGAKEAEDRSEEQRRKKRRGVQGGADRIEFSFRRFRADLVLKIRLQFRLCVSSSGLRR